MTELAKKKDDCMMELQHALLLQKEERKVDVKKLGEKIQAKRKKKIQAGVKAVKS